MGNIIWLMEGLSSQRDIISGIKDFFKLKKQPVTVIASHRHSRNEILTLADIALIEPPEDELRLAFIAATVTQYAVRAIHAGRNSAWFESQRAEIEALGVSLTTGATCNSMLELADDKVEFADKMCANGLPVVPSQRIESEAQLRAEIASNDRLAAGKKRLCVKPVTGIYGMGFWIFDSEASSMAAFTHPDSRKVHPDIYLHALERHQGFAPLVLMPYLPGPEYSVDMLVERGQVIAAVARRKEGALQYLEQSGTAYELARACATCMEADGLVNVQTRNNSQGEPVLLEINMRPSGGIGYTRHSGVNLAGLFAMRRLDLISADDATTLAQKSFSPVVVRSMTDAIPYDLTLDNLVINQGTSTHA